MKKYSLIAIIFLFIFSACNHDYGKINGTVLNEEGEVLVDALVILYPYNENNTTKFTENNNDKSIQTTYTNADGYYEFDNLLEGNYQVKVIIEECSDQIKRAVVLVSETTTVNFEFDCEISCVIPSPIAYYPFNGDSHDQSGNNYHGNLHGAVLTSDRFGNENSAYLFDGINDYISLPNLFDYPERTVCLWFRVIDVPTINQNYVVDRIYVSMTSGLENGCTAISIWEENLVPKIAFRVGANYNENILIDFNEEEWYFAVITVTPNEVKGYFNGELVGTTPFVNHTSVGNYTAKIGTGRSADSRFFSGEIDDVRIFDVALSDEEVMCLFNETIAQ